jgi:hypothetical protein
MAKAKKWSYSTSLERLVGNADRSTVIPTRPVIATAPTFWSLKEAQPDSIDGEERERKKKPSREPCFSLKTFRLGPHFRMLTYQSFAEMEIRGVPAWIAIALKLCQFLERFSEHRIAEGVFKGFLHTLASASTLPLHHRTVKRFTIGSETSRIRNPIK